MLCPIPMRSHRIASATVALWLIGAAPGPTLAQDSAPDNAPSVTNREGEYSGVKPGEAPFKERRKNILSWVGFQASDDGRARVFVQLSSEVPYTQKLESGVLVVRLEGARYRNKNASRRLDMRFFGTALRQVTSRRVGKKRARGSESAQPAGIELRFEFKNPSDAHEASVSSRVEKDGYHYLLLDFRPAAGGSISTRESSIDDPE